MIAHTNKYPASINKIQIFIGMVMLIFGSAIYVIRSSLSSRVYSFVPKYFHNLLFPDNIVNAVSIFGGYIPDFIHPFAFILITAGLASSDNKKTSFFICLSWFLLESFFEVGQYFKEAYIWFIPLWFDNVPILNNTKNYFLNGTFDLLDMLSFFIGTVAAYCVLLITAKG